ncbi:MAG: hypothetical protein COW88_00640 [Candidatus Lloydbacteria bacterium CG22_combo_CG10-13_8_21_14_all_47_15]|uniref:NTP pyrophosphohydrolase MazG-like domain-containing protein n=1 Tax=Candidatus Lloydbacteria bacterium CG22_combo_CG10-13_8_21_14_all_47_15 TaxID=1974635 RepID=A0A2H0CVC5_9BACT|nr:MAG: hypothetical protein COW88_00640 [Candidatus Lloydbacteria bacterium CG22_combo_CG10-13_8_21_14_all_47_15]
MNFSEYQDKAKETALYPEIGKRFVYPALGLVNEAGEVAGKIKKVFRDDGSVLTEKKRDELAYELGDVLWYVSALATELGLSLDDIAGKNIEKLVLRKKRGTISGDGDYR